MQSHRLGRCLSVARTTVIHVLFVSVLRLSGKREIGQFTLFDLAMVLLVANALQPAMTGADQSVLGGAIILATIFMLNRLVSEARVRVPFVRKSSSSSQRRSVGTGDGSRLSSPARASISATPTPPFDSTASSASSR